MKSTVAVPAVAPAAVPAAKPAVKRRRVEADPVAKEVVADVAEAAAPVAPVEVPAPTFESVLGSLDALRATITKAIHETKALQKAVNKAGRRVKKPRDENAPPRKPSGITKPMVVSPELLKFLGTPAGTLLARTQVAKQLVAYSKTNGLMDAEKKNVIHPDAALRKLLKLDAGQTVTIPLLQKSINQHFPPSQKSIKAAAAAAATA